MLKTPTDWVPVVVLQILFVKQQHHNRSSWGGNP